MNIFVHKWSKFLAIFSLVILGLGGTSYLGYLTPQMVQKLALDYGQASFSIDLQYLLMLFLGVFVFRCVYQWAINLFVRDFVQTLRSFCYEKWVLSQDDQGQEDVINLGELSSRIMSDTLAVRELLTSGTFGIIIDISFVFSSFIGLWQLNHEYALPLIALEALASLLLIWGSGKMRSVFHRVRQARGEVSSQLANCLGGVRDAYYFQHGGYAKKTGEVVCEKFLSIQLKANNWDASYYSVAESLYPLFLAFVASFFRNSIVAHSALFLAIIDLIQRSIDPIKNVAGKMANIQRAITGVQRIQEFLKMYENRPSNLVSLHENNANLESPLDELKVDIKSFQYPGRSFMLGPLSFCGKKGQMIGILGSSGGGKSTLMKILSARILLDLEKNDVCIKLKNGEEIRPKSDPQSLFQFKSLIGHVSQDSHLFSETLKFNLSFSNEQQGQEHFYNEMREQIPYLKKWNLKLDDKIDPGQLSLGQKQLICVLRSLYLKKHVVLMDEISSALDSELEEALKTAVLQIQKQALTIIVAHRPETVLKADLILVMKDGKIVEQGRHSQLLQNGEEYQLITSQITAQIVS